MGQKKFLEYAADKAKEGVNLLKTIDWTGAGMFGWRHKEDAEFGTISLYQTYRLFNGQNLEGLEAVVYDFFELIPGASVSKQSIDFHSSMVICKANILGKAIKLELDLTVKLIQNMDQITVYYTSATNELKEYLKCCASWCKAVLEGADIEDSALTFVRYLWLIMRRVIPACLNEVILGYLHDSPQRIPILLTRCDVVFQSCTKELNRSFILEKTELVKIGINLIKEEKQTVPCRTETVRVKANCTTTVPKISVEKPKKKKKTLLQRLFSAHTVTNEPERIDLLIKR